MTDSGEWTRCLNATRLARLLADMPALRLVMLNSCEGARGGARDIFSSTASILVRRGIPAVLAMQYPITDRAAIELARAFYEALACGMPVDEAVVVARQSISLAITNTVEWGTPVLYMRTPDGALFEMPETPPKAASPPPGSRPPPKVDAAQEGRLEQLYLDGLDAFWVREWDQAARCFQAVIEQRPDYKDATDRRREALRQKDLAQMYAQAHIAREAGDWLGARSALEKLAAEAPDYRDVAALLDVARRQVQLADLYAQAQKLHRAGRWQAIVNIFAQIAALEPDYPDPEGLLVGAQQEIQAERRRAEVRDLYARAGQALDAGQWTEVRRLLSQVQEREPGYRETERLLARAEDEIEQQEKARQRQDQVARLYEQAQALVDAGLWGPALGRVEELYALNPQFADPKGIFPRVRAEVEREKAEARRQAELAALYGEAVRLLRAGQYQAALDQWQRVQAHEPQYRDRDQVQATARKKLASSVKVASPRGTAPSTGLALPAPLPAWFWPAAGAAAVLFVFIVIAIVVLGKDGDRGTTAGVTIATDTTPTRTAVATPSPAENNIPATSTIMPASTRQPTATFTTQPTSTPQAPAAFTSTSTPTPKPTTSTSPTPSPPPTATRRRPTATREPTKTSLYPAPALSEPGTMSQLRGLVTFTWQWSGSLAADDYFDLRFWSQSELDAQTSGRGGAAPTKHKQLSINLDSLHTIVEHGGGTTYYWAVVVVHMPGSTVTGEYSEKRAFRYAAAGPPAEPIGQPSPTSFSARATDTPPLPSDTPRPSRTPLP